MKAAVKHLRELLPYLPAQAGRYLTLYVVFSVLLAVLDISALMLLAVSLSAMLSGTPVSLPVLGTVAPQNYVWLLLGISSLVLVKSSLTLVQQWEVTRRLATYELTLGRELFESYIAAPWVERLGRTSASLVRMADVGVAAVVSGLLLPLIQLPALVTTALLILITLVFVQPLTAVITFTYLGLMAYAMHIILSKKSVEAGVVNRRYSYRVAELMSEMVGALKEITLQNKFAEIQDVLQENRSHAAKARANIQFLSTVPRFIMDTALIGGFLVVGFFAYLVEGSLNKAIAAVVFFAVAGLRLVPSLTSFQSLSNSVNANQAQVEAVLADLRQKTASSPEPVSNDSRHLPQTPKELALSNVTFTYPTAGTPALTDVSLSITMGSSVGIVGQSGSGKSTLIDIILGLLSPQQGELSVDGLPLIDVLEQWRAHVGYVPQEVSIFAGTIAQNVALSWDDSPDAQRVEECLRQVQLWDLVSSRPEGINSPVGDQGISLSGGQKQRIGIARALYTDPYVLVLDEATSALDTKTESKVAEAIASLHGQVTVISVAHRLSTVRGADQLFFLEDGFVLARGTFSEVVESVPAFREQAYLAGLVDEDGPLPEE